MLEQISDKLLEIFEELKGDGKPFNEVFDYHTLNNNGHYPYMTFEPIEFGGIVADTCTNEMTYGFQVLIFQEISEGDEARQEAKQIIVKSIVEIIKLLNKNYTLDGLCTRATPAQGTIRPFVIDSGKALVCEMQINITTLENIYQ